MPYVTEAIRMLVAELGERPLIGFAGGPFTLASYLVEGGPSKNHDMTKALMYGHPELWHALLARLADITISFLQVQVAAGASAVQLFDSWVGAIGPDDYRQAILPHTSRIFAALGRRRRAAHPLRGRHGRAARPDGRGRRRCGRGRLAHPAGRSRPAGGTGQGPAGQPGPAVLLAPWEVVEERARDIVGRGRTAEGHVFNLGHGVLPETDPGVLARLTDLVHAESIRPDA